MNLIIVCWNIKGFSTAKLAHSTVGPDVARVFEGADVGIILEASPNLAGLSAAAKLATDASLRDGNSENCGGLGGEEESVAYVRADGVTISKVQVMKGTWDPSIRSPVIFDIKKGSITCRVAAWHAPPPGKDALRSAAWPRILESADNYKVDFLMGDFNAELTVGRRAFECISEGKIYGTTMSNPSLVRADSLKDIVTDEAYDRVYLRDGSKDKFRIEAVALYTSPLPDLAMPARTATGMATKDPHRVYAMSDHLPVVLVVRRKTG